MKSSKPLFMENTEVPVSKTASEITNLLVGAGARQISTDYGAAGEIIGLNFSLVVSEAFVHFALPVRTEPLYQVLVKRRKGWPTDRQFLQIRRQAERVAWRQVLRWVQAQIALIDVGMVEPQEVFLPYLLQAGTDQTLYDHFAQNGLRQITAK